MNTTPGAVLLGKYRVERELGRGGMGVVVAARHIDLDERVAIKFLLQQSQDTELVGRFLREAKAAARLRSEHVARVSDVGRLETGEPYMVMEHLDGRDLEAEVGVRGALPIVEAVDWVLQAMEAIAEAHKHGIVHRDLKPANLFLTSRADGSPCVKVLDFGISKLIANDGNSAHGMTSTQGMMGSPLYMSPEQLASAKDVDARTDIWALGVILYQLSTGRFPFFGESLPQLVAAVFHREPEPVRVHRPAVGEALERVILSCLAKAREQRCSSVAELATRLAPFASDEGRISVTRIHRTAGLAASRPGAPTPLPVPAAAVATTDTRPHTATQSSFGATAWEVPRSGRPFVVLAIVAAIVAGGAFGAYVRLRGPNDEPAHHGSAKPRPALSAEEDEAPPEVSATPSIAEAPAPASASAAMPELSAPPAKASAAPVSVTKPATKATTTVKTTKASSTATASPVGTADLPPAIK